MAKRGIKQPQVERGLTEEQRQTQRESLQMVRSGLIFFSVLGFEFRAFTLSHITSPFL
jgi:hypothetical protein